MTAPAYIRIAERIKQDFLQNAQGQEEKIPTQETLAARYGVSRSTIVRSLSHLVAEGWLRSQQGSGAYRTENTLRETEMPQIGLIVPSLHSPVITATCRGVERRARQLGFRVLLASSDFSREHEGQLVEQHLRNGARGVVIYPVTRYRHELEDDYLTHWNRETPIVTLDIGCEEWNCARVQFDNFRLGYDMTRLLLRHGHRHIAFMHIEPDWLHSSIAERRQGWEAAMREAGFSIPESYRSWPVPNGGRKMENPDYVQSAERLLALQPRPDAVICWNDVTAAQMIQTLTDLDVAVPDGIRVTGFDSEPLIARLFRPLFPTSKPDFVRLGEIGVETLYGSLQGGPKPQRVYYYPVPAVWREARRGAMPGEDMYDLNALEMLLTMTAPRETDS